MVNTVCIVCGKDKHWVLLSGWGYLCSNECYAEFDRLRQEWMAHKLWGERAKLRTITPERLKKFEDMIKTGSKDMVKAV